MLNEIIEENHSTASDIFQEHGSFSAVVNMIRRRPSRMPLAISSADFFLICKREVIEAHSFRCPLPWLVLLPVGQHMSFSFLFFSQGTSN